MSLPENWRRILQKKIDSAPAETAKPRPLPIPGRTPRPVGGAGRRLTEAESIMFKRITGTTPRPEMTREEYNRIIAKYRKGGGLS